MFNNNKTLKRASAVVAVVLLASFLTLALSTFAFADTVAYHATLTGGNEVPANTSGTTGEISVLMDDINGTGMHYNLNASGGDITAAHLHCGTAGQNGPVVASLWSGNNATTTTSTSTASTTTIPTTQSTIASSGSISNSNIQSANCASTTGTDISTASGLAQAIASGKIYANVHTSSYPDGAARGQLMLSGGSTSTTTDNGGVVIVGTTTVPQMSDAELLSLVMQLRTVLNQIQTLLLIQHAQAGWWDTNGVWHGVTWSSTGNSGASSITPGAAAIIGPNGAQSITY